MKEITVVETNSISAFPPVQNLLKVLLKRGYGVVFIGKNIDEISADIKGHPNYEGHEIGRFRVTNGFIKLFIERLHMLIHVNRSIKKYSGKSDVLWTTSYDAIRIVGKMALKYKNVLQLMELTEHGYYYKHFIRFPLEEYAKRSWKTVVPEINRAYIQKTWWDLPKVPYVLPNKPYDLLYDTNSPEIAGAVDRMKNEHRKIILYLGVIYGDRNLEGCARAVQSLPDYILYIVGKPQSSDDSTLVHFLEQKYGAVYLGYFNPPQHLALVKYANIGLLPYMANRKADYSPLNALYCAPNKIWEYAGFGVPMVGSDAMGLRLPFDQWNIGICCDMNDESSIIDAIKYVDEHHNEMSVNCHKFYDSVDLNEIISDILED